MRRSLFVAAILLFPAVGTAAACDLCAIHNSARLQQPERDSVRFGVHEQFAEYNRLERDGEHVDNSAHEHLNSAITQLYGGYGFSDHLAVDLNLPYINRRFKRAEGDGIEEGTEAGIGDLSLLARWVPYDHKEKDVIFLTEVTAGIKLPTGDSGRLKEEDAEEPHVESAEHPAGRHGGVDHGTASAIHGHDLALGSGSADFPVGFRFFFEKGRLFVSGDLQYVFRTEGDEDYRYANDLIWNYGPAYQLILDDSFTLAGRVKLSGEHKGSDKQHGELSDDTAIDVMFLGPQAVFTIGDEWSIESGVDWPVYSDNSGLQAVNTYKLQAALSYRFK